MWQATSSKFHISFDELAEKLAERCKGFCQGAANNSSIAFSC